LDNQIISTPEDKLASTVVENMKETIKKAKHRRSDEARAAVNLITASASVENIVESRAETLPFEFFPEFALGVMSIFWGLGELVSHRFCLRLDVNFPGNTKN
jgi:hypothetical protein